MKRSAEPLKFRAYVAATLEKIGQIQALDPELRLEMKAVASVLPFRVNQYVVDELIDWSRVPDDPIFRLTFPQPEMLEEEDLESMVRLIKAGASQERLSAEAGRIRLSLNPHPSGQMELNRVSLDDGTILPGLQHKYADTCLVFPGPGQTCHAYCTYCFRWAQFIGMDELKFAQREMDGVLTYLGAHEEISDVLLTGGDPMVMGSRLLRKYIEPLLGPGFEHIQDIRIGTKSIAYWPQRFVTDADADDLLRLFEEVRRAGKHLAIMGHISHPTEMSTGIAREAIRRIRDAGAELRCQAPLIRHVNDDAEVWATMWKEQVRLGAIPYYMFIERDTGPKHYFEVSLARAYRIFRNAWKGVTGLARTVRGPSMSATPGKIQIDGVARIRDEQVFVCSFLRARNPDWVRRPFFAQFDETACWLDDLRPAFGESSFFFERTVPARRNFFMRLIAP
ncbi:MAG: lysine 2,3-aminomutase [Planctomycetota bacterium]